MNKHIIVEEHPNALRHVILSLLFSAGVFATLGFFGRPVWDAAWDRWMEIPQVTVPCVPEPKPTMQWGKQK